MFLLSRQRAAQRVAALQCASYRSKATQRHSGNALSLQHCTPRVIVYYVCIRRIWRPLIRCDEIWTVGLQFVQCAARCVCWRTIRLEDESGEQLAIALKEQQFNDNLQTK